MVANVGIAVAIGSQDHSVQLLFPFLVSVAVILNFGSRATSENVAHDRKCESRGWNHSAISYLQAYFHFQLGGPHLECWYSRTTSGKARSDIVSSDMVEHIGVVVEIAALSLAVQTLFQVPA